MQQVLDKMYMCSAYHAHAKPHQRSCASYVRDCGYSEDKTSSHLFAGQEYKSSDGMLYGRMH